MADQQTLNASPMHACRSSAVSADAAQPDATNVSAAAIEQSSLNAASPDPQGIIDVRSPRSMTGRPQWTSL